MHNVTGGPRFISDDTDIVYAIILGNLVQSVLLLIVGIGLVFAANLIVKTPLRYLIPFVVSISMMGAFAITGSMLGPLTVAGAGALGWLMKRYGYPVTAMVVGLLIGPMAEGELVRSWQISRGEIGFILERPITLVLLALLVGTVSLSVLASRRASAHAGGEADTPLR